MKPPLRVGLVGCGRIGAATRPELLARLGPNWLPLSHADALQAVPELRLAACCDADLPTARATASRYGAALAFSNHEQLLREASPDVLCVATRSDVRPRIVCDAAASGVRAVHCEKPLATSVSEAARMCRMLEDRSVAFSYGALRGYMPVYRRARDIAASGALGEIRSVTVRFGRSGLLWDHPHSVALLFFFSGTPDVDYVQANLDLAEGDHRLVDCDPLVASATVAFRNGVIGSIVAEGGRTVTVAGTEGAVSVAGNGNWIVRESFGARTAAERWQNEKDESTTSGRVIALRELRNALLSGARTSLRPADALRQHQVLFAMVQSHMRGGRRVSLAELEEDLVVTGSVQGKPA